jgi:hypothetical protein
MQSPRSALVGKSVRRRQAATRICRRRRWTFLGLALPEKAVRGRPARNIMGGRRAGSFTDLCRRSLDLAAVRGTVVMRHQLRPKTTTTRRGGGALTDIEWNNTCEADTGRC